jgi:hypothetical protein
MSDFIAEKNIPISKIYKLSPSHTWAFDFYNRKPVNVMSLGSLDNHRDIWIYAADEDIWALREYGFDWDAQYSVDQFRITRLQAKFMDPVTRKKVLNKMHLVHIY